jgi:2-polyprenyl-3-methyl-5-hydroxy-6-metoxy-1,4-benzoquinol methylase
MFTEKGVLYRFVSQTYQEEYDALMQSGLYDALVKEQLLIPHTEVSQPRIRGAYKILKPELVPFISYPYEWSFSQLKDAALATMQIQFLALKHGLILKDARAYNIQFYKGKPVFIDTLSFERYQEGNAWVGYRQFCQHFLAPLALMSQVDLRLGLLSQQFLDGIPLDLASRLLPAKSRFSLGLGSHIHLHARSQKQHANDASSATAHRKMPKANLLGLLRNLEMTVQSLRLPRQDTEWGDYYENTNYTNASLQDKEKIIAGWVTLLKPRSVWDAGANDGTFSRIASRQNIPTVASDIDPMAIEQAYQSLKKHEDSYLLPLIIDLTNPSPAIGWENQERLSFLHRGQFDLTFALALIHHLAISNNLPLGHIAAFFRAHTKGLIIEFVPKEDSNTQRLLATRPDIFPDYTPAGFEKAFTAHFTIKEKVPVKESTRILYRME